MTTAGKRRGLLALCLVGAVMFSGLGIWQVQRLGWKRDLIARVDARLAAEPVELPDRTTWSSFDSRADEYRRVRVRGVFDHERATLVDALTERGAGAWIVTPLRTSIGIVLVNRGFVPLDHEADIAHAAGRPAGEVSLSGLLRASEPGGRPLRQNDPAHDRWYSRDVRAIAAARGLASTAPFFIDADATPNPGGFPVGGLTVVRFRNAHLVYALTWFALAGLCVAGVVLSRRVPPT